MFRSEQQRRTSAPRILSIDLVGPAMGYVVLEGTGKPVDWGIKDGRRSDPNLLLRKLDALLDLYRPHVLVLEDCSGRHSRRAPRVRTMLAQIKTLATRRSIHVHAVAWNDVRQHFLRHGGYTKHEIARLVAAALPALSHRLPPPRKPWKSEDTRMGIFDAAAFGLTYYAQADADRPAVAKS